MSTNSHGWRFTHYASPIGRLLLIGEIVDGALSVAGIYFVGASKHAAITIPEGALEDASGFAHVIEQLEAYFSGRRTAFDIPLAPRGTAFQRQVWKALAEIPYGTTTTYAAVARSIGKPNAVRAVGAANGRNPISIVVPCHRVIGQDGTLTGYAGGIENKRALLDLESRQQRF
jgi:methylated-DNA-[protein]-cysteine S-methyltransferase